MWKAGAHQHAGALELTSHQQAVIIEPPLDLWLRQCGEDRDGRSVHVLVRGAKLLHQGYGVISEPEDHNMPRLQNWHSSPLQPSDVVVEHLREDRHDHSEE